MNQDVDRNKKLFWKEVGKVGCGKGEDCSRIKARTRRLVVREDDV